MVKGNLLVSFDPVHEESAKAEILGMLKQAKHTAKIVRISEGLAELSVKSAKKAVTDLLSIAKKDNSKFKYTFNWWPVDKWCKSDLTEMQKVLKGLKKEIKPSEKWKMDLIKRKMTKNYGMDLIVQLTNVIDRPNVDLNNPQKTIKIEIDGDKAAISVLKQEEILNVPRLKS